MNFVGVFKNCFLCAFSSVFVGISNSSVPITLAGPDASISGFDFFKNDLDVNEKVDILWSCVNAGLVNEEKSVDLAKHLIKGKHLIPITEIGKKQELQLGLPINLEKEFFDFVNSFYLMLDISQQREGALQALEKLIVHRPLSWADICCCIIY